MLLHVMDHVIFQLCYIHLILSGYGVTLIITILPLGLQTHIITSKTFIVYVNDESYIVLRQENQVIFQNELYKRILGYGKDNVAEKTCSNNDC
jgi:hypothetical protein